MKTNKYLELAKHVLSKTEHTEGEEEKLASHLLHAANEWMDKNTISVLFPGLEKKRKNVGLNSLVQISGEER